MIRGALPLLPLVLGPIVISDSANGTESIFDLSLEELGEVSVSVSSKVDLPMSLSPASVSVFDHRQLYQSGIHQLADLADITPAYASYSIFGERVLETRGQKAGSFENNKHLVLLDGIRLNHARANKAPIENELPLWAMDKLQILRGPASALYGQSAFYGVVSVDSMFSETDDLSGEVTYSPQNEGARLNLMGNLHTALGHSYLVYSQFDKESSNAFVGPEFSIYQQYYDDQDANFVYARQHFNHDHLGAFSLGYIELERQSGLGEHWVGNFSTPENNILWSTEIIYLQWNKKWNARWNSSLKWVNNNSVEQGTATNSNREQAIDGEPITFNQYRVDVRSQLIEAELSWQMGERESLIAGLSVEQRQDLGGFFVADLSVDELAGNGSHRADSERAKSDKVLYQGAYLQYYSLLSFWENLHLTAGLRYDKGEYLDDDFSQWSPRIALVKQFNPNWTAKASYSSAFRSPGLKEYLLNAETKGYIADHALSVDIALGKVSESLNAETFESTELSFVYQDSPVIVKLNGFYNQTKNALDGQTIMFIDKQGDLVSKNSFSNSSQDYSVYGAEIELEWRLSPLWHLTGFISQAFSYDDSKLATMDVAKFKSNLSLTGDLSWATLNFNQRYHGDIDGDVDNISTFDTTLSDQRSALNWYIKVANLFNEQNYYPVNGAVGNPMPERTFEFGLAYKFK